MSMLFSSLREDETPQEKYKSITGFEYPPTSISELERQIERDLADPYCSKIDRVKLMDLREQINNSK